MRGPNNKLEFMAGFQGSVFPPIIAIVSIAAAGATAVKNELWTIFDDFLKAKEDTFLTIEKNDYDHVLLLPI